LPSLPLTCTAGVRTLLSPLSSNLTVKTASPSVRVPTLTWSNPSNTTHVPPMPVSTCTPSPFAPRSTNLLAAATSPELTTLSFNLSFLPELSLVLPPPRSVFTPLITTFSVSCRAWPAWLTATKLTALFC